VNQVDCPHIQRRGHSHAPGPGDEPLDEVEADLPVIQAAIDMRLGDIDQRRRANRPRK
jgi:hypothetical protein